MAIFSALAATAFWGGVTAAIGTTAAAAIIAVGQAVTFSLVGAALNRSKVPRQTVMAQVKQTDQPRVRAYGRNLLGGVKAFYEARRVQGRVLFQIIVAHHGPVDGLVRYWKDGQPITVDANGQHDRYTTFEFRDGSGDGGEYDVVRRAFPDLWPATARLAGQATYHIRMGDPSDRNLAKFYPNGPNTQVQVELRASRVRDMAGNEIYSENAGLCLRDFFTHADGWAIPEGRLDPVSWARFVAICAERVARPGGTTEARYRLCGYYTLEDPLKDTTGRMLATCDGQIYETAEGQIGILGGAWSAPDVTLTGDDILSVEMRDGFNPLSVYNVLRGSFVSPEHAYQETEVPERRDATALMVEGERSERLDVEMCPSGGQLQRLMKIKMAKDRRRMIGTLRTNLVGLKARFPRGEGVHTIRVQAEEFGLNDVFEVTSHTFSVVDGFCEIGIASLDNPYFWQANQENPLPPQHNEITGTAPVALPPQGAVLVQEQVQVTSLVQGVKLVVSVDDPGGDGLELSAQIARGDIDLIDGPLSLYGWIDMPGDRLRAESGLLDDGQVYTVRVRWSKPGLGAGDGWVRAGAVRVVADPTPPSAPSAFDGMVVGASAYLDWTNTHGGYARTQILMGTNSDPAAADPVAVITGNPGRADSVTVPLPSGTTTWRFWARTLNASGVPSDYAGPVLLQRA